LALSQIDLAGKQSDNITGRSNRGECLAVDVEENMQWCGKKYTIFTVKACRPNYLRSILAGLCFAAK
jgi:hypothetical protein